MLEDTSSYFIIIKVTLGKGGVIILPSPTQFKEQHSLKSFHKSLDLKSVPASVCLQLGSNDRLALLIQAV